jgi:uncharacterized repeat protein (TIGR02543 family)
MPREARRAKQGARTARKAISYQESMKRCAMTFAGLLLAGLLNAATFVEDPIDTPLAFVGVAYSNSLAGAAVDAELDALAYSKVSGPAWLNVSADGVLSGTPASAGTNVWIVQVDDGHGGTDEATLRIRVLASGVPQLLIGGAVRNGDFNANPGASVTYEDTTHWYNTKGSQTSVATRNDSTLYDGSQSAMLISSRGFGNDTGHTIADGDSFDFSYVWQDAGSWIDGADQVTFSLFITADNTITGARTNLFVDYSGLSQADYTYELVSRIGAYTASASHAGKRLFAAIETTSAGWARLDDVTLTVNPFIQLTDLQVVYQGNGSTGGSVPVDSTNPHTSGETVTVLGNTGGLVRAGYTFAGWNTRATGSGTAYSPGSTLAMPLINVTLYAQWISNTSIFTNGYMPERVNLAKFQDVTVSSTNVTGAPAYLTDGLVIDSSCWRSGIVGPHWAQLDFPYPVQVGSAQLAMGQSGSGAMSAFQIQYLTNGNWVTVPGGYVTGNTNVEKNIVFADPVTAASFRVYNSADSVVTIREWALYPPNGPGGYAFGTDYMISVSERQPTFATTNTYGCWPLLATDGLVDPSSAWQTMLAGTNVLLVNMQFTNRIGSAHLYSGMTGVPPLTNFVLQYWTGSAWADIPGGSVSGNTDAARVISFSTPVTTTKVQLFFTNTSVSAVQELCIFPENSNGGYPLGTGVITNTPVTQKYSDTFDSFYYLSNSVSASVIVGSNTVPVLGAAGFKDWKSQYQVLLNYDKGTYRLLNRASRLCLAGAQLSTAAGGGLTEEAYSALPHQDWYLQPVDGTNFCFVNQFSGLAVTAQGGGLVQATLTGAASQLWQLRFAQGFPKKGIAGTGPLKNWPTLFRSSWFYIWWYNVSVVSGDSLYYPVDEQPPWVRSGNINNNLWKFHSTWRKVGRSLILKGFVEPDNTSAYFDPTNSAIAWMNTRNLNFPVSGPNAVDVNGTWNQTFLGYLRNWGCHLDYLGCSRYGGVNRAGSSDAFIGAPLRAYNTYGIPMWISEFGIVDHGGTGSWSEEDIYTALAEFLWRAESLSWLQKYSLFPYTEDAEHPMAPDPWTRTTPAPRSNAFDLDRNFTPFGQLYAAWDCDASVQTGKVIYVFNHGTRKQIQNTAVINATDIRCNNPTVKWTLQSAGSANLYYLVSEVDGKRLSYTNGGAVSLVASNSTGTASQWSLTEYEYGWFYLNHPATATRLKMAFDNANAIATYSMVPDTTATTAERWRFNVPLPPPAWVGTTNNLWTSPYNWTYQVRPIIGQTVTFDEQSTTNLNMILGADHDLAKITVTAPDGAVTIGGTNTLTLGHGGIDMSGASQNFAVSAAMVLSSTQSWSVAAGRVLSISGGASGSGAGLSVTGDGKVFLGSLASYTGDTTLSAGSTLQIGLDNALPWGAGCGAIAVHGTLDLNGYSQAINGLSGSGLIDSTAAGTMTLTLSNSTSTVFSGGIRNTAGSLSLVKEGAGTLTLSGTNTYSGTTAVSGGSLMVNGLLSSSGGAVSVSNAATLGGTGTIARTVTVAGGGTLAPGLGFGTLTVISNVTVYSGAKLSVTLDDAAPQYCGKLEANNNIAISNATLQIATNGAPNQPVYVIAEYGTLVGSFAVTNGLPAGYYLDYAYNSGKTIAVVSAAADSDGDGIPNGWEIARGLNPYNSGDASIDTDNDKFTSRQEYWSGTDPDDSNSFFRIDSLSFEGSNLVLRWRHAAVDPVIPPISIQRRASLITGVWVHAWAHSPTNGTNSWVSPLPDNGFFRLCVTNVP